MDSHEPDFIIAGEKVALGPLRADLAPAYARWRNQLEVRQGLVSMGIATPQSQEKWVEENIAKGAEREPEAVEFTVYDRTDSTAVGTAGLFHIAHAHGTATFGIAIGERRGHGLGTEATRLALDFAFHVLQLRNVGVERRRVDGVRTCGISAHRCAPRCGDQPAPTDRRCPHGRRPRGLRRVGAALTQQRSGPRGLPDLAGALACR
jgi:RimJ/RimL family protein N-acetyltransferase